MTQTHTQTQTNSSLNSQPTTSLVNQTPHQSVYFQPTGQLMTYYKAADSGSLWLLPLTNVIVAAPIFVGTHPTIDTQTNSGAQTLPVVCNRSPVLSDPLERITLSPFSDCTAVPVASNQRLAQVEQANPSLLQGHQRSV